MPCALPRTSKCYRPERLALRPRQAVGELSDVVGAFLGDLHRQSLLRLRRKATLLTSVVAAHRHWNTGHQARPSVHEGVGRRRCACSSRGLSRSCRRRPWSSRARQPVNEPAHRQRNVQRNRHQAARLGSGAPRSETSFAAEIVIRPRSRLSLDRPTGQTGSWWRWGRSGRRARLAGFPARWLPSMP